MKKYLLLVILILIAVMPVFSQAESYFSYFWAFGGGTDVGFQWTVLGLQFGVKLESPFNFLLEASGGFAWKENDGSTGSDDSDASDKPFFGFHYRLGGLIEFRFVEMLTLGAGGGLGGGIFFGQYSYFYPYIRGSISSSFIKGFLKLGLYYDYGFEYGSMFGFRIHLCTSGE